MPEDDVIKTINQADLSEEDKIRVQNYELIDNEDGLTQDEIPCFLEDDGEKGKREAQKIVKHQLWLKIIKGTASELDCHRYSALNSSNDYA